MNSPVTVDPLLVLGLIGLGLVALTCLMLFRPAKPALHDHRLFLADGSVSELITKAEAIDRFRMDPSVVRVEKHDGTIILTALSRGPLGKMPEHF